MQKNPSKKYRPFPPVALPDRQWPDRVLTRAPIWCSVDLRDGNQALAVPMNVSQKLELFQTLVKIGFREVITAEKIGKLSIVGVGMKSHTGVAGKLFETLAKEGVNISMISTSEIKISVVIDLAKAEQAVKAVHAAFIGN